MKSSHSLLLALAVLGATPAITLARPGRTASSTTSTEARARAHFAKGKELSAAGRFAEALAEFSAGYELSKRPLFLFNMGECARALEDVARARGYYEDYVAADPRGAFIATARARLDELGPAVAAPAPAPTVTTPPPAKPTIAKPTVAKPAIANPSVANPSVANPTKPTVANPVVVAPSPRPVPTLVASAETAPSHDPFAVTAAPRAESTSHWKRNALLVGLGVVVAGSVAIYVGTRDRECGIGCVDLR